jgi:hypothetical protein
MLRLYNKIRAISVFFRGKFVNPSSSRIQDRGE